MGYSQIGKQFAIKSILAIIGLALIVHFIPYPLVTSDKLLIAVFGGFFLGAGIVAPEPYDIYLFAIPMIALFIWTGKWWVWDQVKASWNKYQTEKQELFTNIKNSDK